MTVAHTPSVEATIASATADLDVAVAELESALRATVAGPRHEKTCISVLLKLAFAKVRLARSKLLDLRGSSA